MRRKGKGGGGHSEREDGIRRIRSKSCSLSKIKGSSNIYRRRGRDEKSRKKEKMKGKETKGKSMKRRLKRRGKERKSRRKRRNETEENEEGLAERKEGRH